MTIGERIKARRQALHMSQRDLAERMEYANHSTIARIEAGTVDLPQSRIAQFAEALGTTPSQLMGWDVNPTDAGAIAARVLKDPETFQFMKNFMELDEVDRYALRLAMETLKVKKAKKETSAEALVVEVE